MRAHDVVLSATRFYNECQEDTPHGKFLRVQSGQSGGIFLNVQVQVVPVSHLNVEEQLCRVILHVFGQVDQEPTVQRGGRTNTAPNGNTKKKRSAVRCKSTAYPLFTVHKVQIFVHEILRYFIPPAGLLRTKFRFWSRSVTPNVQKKT